MELRITVTAGSRQPPVDVELDVAVGTPLSELLSALWVAAAPAGEPPRQPADPNRVYVDGCRLDPATPLGSGPLRDGAVVAFAPMARCQAPTSGLELRSVGGPDAGGRVGLSPATLVVGRAPTVDIALDDPDVSREHLRLVVTPTDVSVTDLKSTNGTTIDGQPTGDGPVPWPSESLLRLGESTLTLATGLESPAAVTAQPDGRLAVNRPPRLLGPAPQPTINLPVAPEPPARGRWPVLSVILPVIIGVVTYLVTHSAFYLLFLALSPVLALGTAVSDRLGGRRSHRSALRRYRADRAAAEEAMHGAAAQDATQRRAESPDLAALLATAMLPAARLWERRPTDADFLTLRVGLADLPARLDVSEGGVAAAPPLVDDVPACLPLPEAGVVGLAGPPASVRALARALLAQIATLHGPRDAAIVILAADGRGDHWQWARWLPHLLAAGGEDYQAAFGLDHSQRAARVGELAALVGRRRTARTRLVGRSSDEPAVVVVIDGAQSLRATPGLTGVLTDGPAVGVYAVCLDEDERALPSEAGATVVTVNDVATRLMIRRAGESDVGPVVGDGLASSRAEALARALAPLRDQAGGGVELPSAVRWHTLVGLRADGGDAELIAAAWAARPASTTAALGVDTAGEFAVDLRRDGPHALVAGTTGAGKSELLQTLIASLAAGNRPEELSFVLVDYKGGAAFGACAALPHVAGVVTDLDAALTERALVSLAAELRRRERLLADSGAKDIDDHRRTDGPPLGRLVIVVDEFAALAEELPDFVTGLVGVAARGRSLGVHLVLATQRPEGVVRADIRANTNLRICLAVTRESESRDVIDAPDAATISRRQPGRGYARTGHAELTCFQAARVGGRRAGGGTAAAATVTLSPYTRLGDPLPRPVEPADETVQTDLGELVAAIRVATERLAARPAPSPWLPPLADRVSVAELAALPPAAAAGDLPAVSVGVHDLPARQQRGRWCFDLVRAGHFLVIGSPRSGRTTTLRTIAGQLAAAVSMDDLHLYAIDHGGGGLLPLAELPHCGAVVTGGETERLGRLLRRLTADIGRRQALLAAVGAADITEARRHQRLPHLLVLVDQWEAFLTTYQDLDAGRRVDEVLRCARDGPAVGIHLVVSADRSGLHGRLAANISDRLVLRLADRGDYALAGLSAKAVPEQVPPGRGWTNGAVTTQVALLDPDPAGTAQLAALGAIAGAARAGHGEPGRRPWRVDALPTSVRLDELPTASAVLGVGGDEIGPICVPLEDGAGTFVVGGPPRSGRSTALLTTVRSLLAGAVPRPVVAVAPRPSPLRTLVDVPGCLAMISVRDADARLAEVLAGAGGPITVVVDDAETLIESPVAAVLDAAVRAVLDRGGAALIGGTTEELAVGYRGFIADARRGRRGLLLAPSSSVDGELFGVRLPRDTGAASMPPGRGVLVRPGELITIQVALP